MISAAKDDKRYLESQTEEKFFEGIKSFNKKKVENFIKLLFFEMPQFGLILKWLVTFYLNKGLQSQMGVLPSRARDPDP